MDEYTCFMTDSIVSIIVLSLLKQGITIDILGMISLLCDQLFRKIIYFTDNILLFL
jgi:hypothetical protein